MDKTLIVTDVQKGFINRWTEHIPARIAELIRKAQFDDQLFTKFLNEPESPFERILGWDRLKDSPETDLVPELQEFARKVFVKTGYSAFQAQGFEEYLRVNKLKDLYIVGIDTDVCVLKTAVDAFEKGFHPRVLTDYCASSRGLKMHKAGLSVLKRFIGEKNLLSGPIEVL